jgi:hypothetical protein
LGGFTMSEEGGLEDVEESLRAAANCSWSWATAARKDWISSCKRWHPGQGVAVSAPILSFYDLPVRPALST